GVWGGQAVRTEGRIALRSRDGRPAEARAVAASLSKERSDGKVERVRRSGWGDTRNSPPQSWVFRSSLEMATRSIRARAVAGILACTAVMVVAADDPRKPPADAQRREA